MTRIQIDDVERFLTLESHSLSALMLMYWFSLELEPVVTASCSQRATRTTPPPRSHLR